MIGIIDYEFMVAGRRLTPPSLGALKLATFLKKEQKDQVILLNKLEQAKNCKKVFFFTNLPMEKLPKEVFLWDNVTFYGKFFEPLPQIVEHQIPSISLYKDDVQEKVTKKAVTIEKAMDFLEGIYYQAYGAKGEILPLPPIGKKKRVWVYDEDLLGANDGWKVVARILERSPTAVYTIHPILCHTIKQFILVRRGRTTALSRTNEVILDYFVPLHQIETYFAKYKMLLLGEITKTSKVFIYLGKNYSSNAYGETFYLRNIYYCLTLICSYWTRKIPIKTKIYYQTIQPHGFEKVLEGIRKWTTSPKDDIPLMEFIGVEDWKKLTTKNPHFYKFEKLTRKQLFNEQGVWRAE